MRNADTQDALIAVKYDIEKVKQKHLVSPALDPIPSVDPPRHHLLDPIATAQER